VGLVDVMTAQERSHCKTSGVDQHTVTTAEHTSEVKVRSDGVVSIQRQSCPGIEHGLDSVWRVLGMRQPGCHGFGTQYGLFSDNLTRS